jgi:hypothetical protein
MKLVIYLSIVLAIFIGITVLGGAVEYIINRSKRHGS